MKIAAPTVGVIEEAYACDKIYIYFVAVDICSHAWPIKMTLKLSYICRVPGYPAVIT